MELKEKVGIGAALVLLVGGIVGGLLQPFLPAPMQAPFVTLERVLPNELLITGVVLALGILAIGYLRESPGVTSHATPLVPPEQPPERPQRSPARVGSPFDAAITDGAQAVWIKQASPDETAARNELRQIAIAVLSLARGCPKAEAESIIADGEWTDDRVAKAFLSTALEYPQLYRLFQWARPELAYERAVTRTLVAIDAVVRSELPQYSERSGQATPPTISEGVRQSQRPADRSEPSTEREPGTVRQ